MAQALAGQDPWLNHLASDFPRELPAAASLHSAELQSNVNNTTLEIELPSNLLAKFRTRGCKKVELERHLGKCLS